jgi:monovalent cation/proton antiporter MnhG/PhaG subunit
VTGPAVILVLLASIAGSAETVTSSVLIVLFLLITSPLSTHAIARAAYQQDNDAQEPERQPDSPEPE